MSKENKKIETGRPEGVFLDKSIRLRINSKLKKELEIEARKNSLDVSALIRLWLQDRLREEKKR